MRNLGASPWLEKPRLQVIESGDKDTINDFRLTLAQTTPGENKEQDQGSGDQKAAEESS
jgi:Tfp pilus assembly protein PilN